MNCTICNKEIADNAKFCQHCGAEQKAPEDYDVCRECGQHINKGAAFCEHCGAAQNICHNCGGAILPGQIYCPHCGEKTGPKTYRCTCGEKAPYNYDYCPNCGKPRAYTELVERAREYDRVIGRKNGQDVHFLFVPYRAHKKKREDIFLNDVERASALVEKYGSGNGLFKMNAGQGGINARQVDVKYLGQLLSLYVGHNITTGIQLPNGDTFAFDFEKDLKDLKRHIGVTVKSEVKKKGQSESPEDITIL